MTLREDLVAAKALIDTPKMWKRAAGEDGFGTPCCAVIAANRVARFGEDRNENMRRALWNALPPKFQKHSTLCGHDVGQFNDDRHTTHADIMALFQRAIDACEN